MTQPLNGENDHRAFLELHWADFIFLIAPNANASAKWLYPSGGTARIALNRDTGEPLNVAPPGFELVYANYRKLLARYRLLILAYLEAGTRCS